MTRTRAAALFLVCLALLHPRPAAAQTPPVMTVPSAGVVTVLSNGAEPRRALRYTAPAPSKQRVDLTMKMSLAMAMGDVDLPAAEIPPMRMAMDMDVTSVNTAGDISFTFRYADFSADGAPVPAELADLLSQIRGAVTMTGIGTVKSLSFDGETSITPMVKQLIASAGIEKLASPLPLEPVGVGARWEMSQPISMNGMTLVQKSTYELVAFDGASATLKMTMAQSGETQKVALPEMPPGAEVSLVSMEGGGTGTMTLSPGALILFGDMDVRTKIVMDVSAEGESHRMTTESTLKVSLAPGKR